VLNLLALFFFVGGFAAFVVMNEVLASYIVNSGADQFAANKWGARLCGHHVSDGLGVKAYEWSLRTDLPSDATAQVRRHRRRLFSAVDYLHAITYAPAGGGDSLWLVRRKGGRTAGIILLLTTS